MFEIMLVRSPVCKTDDIIHDPLFLVDCVVRVEPYRLFERRVSLIESPKGVQSPAEISVICRVVRFEQHRFPERLHSLITLVGVQGPAEVNVVGCVVRVEPHRLLERGYAVSHILLLVACY